MEGMLDNRMTENKIKADPEKKEQLPDMTTLISERLKNSPLSVESAENWAEDLQSMYHGPTKSAWGEVYANACDRLAEAIREEMRKEESYRGV
jgi:hypothetical protein